jgi:peptidylprolyl isomerase
VSFRRFGDSIESLHLLGISHLHSESSAVPKKLLSSLAIAAVALSLVACSGSGEPAKPDCEATASGANSSKVEVSGKADEAPTVEFPTPLTASATERSVITDGSGDIAVEGSAVTLDIAAYNATSGEEITALTAEGAELVLEDPLLPGILNAVLCSPADARVAAVVPPAEAFGEAGQEQLGLAASDSVVFVIDVVKVAEPVKALPRADGEDQPAEEGFPTVELAEDGAPTITIPATDPPSELRISVLKQGDGAEVAEGDTVTVHYTGVDWATGEVFDSSWTRGEPAPFGTDQVIPGFGKALVGQKVGSQVIAVIPPAEGYGDTPPEGSTITPTSTLVFVADILATQ